MSSPPPRERSPDRGRSAVARGIGALATGVILAALAVALLPLRPWEDDGSEAWAMTVYVVVAGASLLLGVVISAQAFAVARDRAARGSAGGADLLTVLALLLLLLGAALAFVRGFPVAAGPYVLGLQVLGGLALVACAAGNGHALRRR